MSPKRFSTHPFDTCIIIISMHHYIKIIISQQAPSIWTNALVIRFNQVSTTLGIAFARQLHRFSPLIKPPIRKTYDSVIVITISFYFRVI